MFVLFSLFYLSNRALVHGAVISAFLTIAHAMTDQGCV
jgi:hypothetical protein